MGEVNNETDSQLLRRYAESRSEESFTFLVSRHVDFVYSAALRMVSDSHLAKDVTQGVFIALAKNAAQLTTHPVLSGWLHRTARNLAAETVRTNVRRQSREQEAAAMNELLSAEPDASWDDIAPQLDAALGELSESDRDALLLRYFEKKSARQMAQTLGITEDAAQKRVNRAVERLRDFFSKRGVAIGASGFVAILSANAVQAAPVGLAVTISTAATLVGTAIATTTTTSVTKAIVMTTLQKTLITGTLVAAVGTVIYEARQISEQQKQLHFFEKQQASLDTQLTELKSEIERLSNLVAQAKDSQALSQAQFSELLKLRGEVTAFRNESRKLSAVATSPANDPTSLAAQAWINRVKSLKQRFEQWPGKKTQELQLLNEQDWLNEAAKRSLDSEEDWRQAMSSLRWEAKRKFSEAVNKALTKFAEANNQLMPSDSSQLTPYLKPAESLCLADWQVAQPGWVRPPQPSGENSERAKVWALIEKGSFTPDGTAIRNGSYSADSDYDMTMVIYQGGHYGYGPDKIAK